MPCALRGVHHRLDHPDDGWVGGLIKMSNVVVSTIDGDGVLDQIVCPDAEEFDFAGEMGRGKRGAGHLDHDSHLDVGIELRAFPPQLATAFVQNGIGAAQFFQARNHRVHHTNVPDRRRSENGAQLRFENLRMLQTIADRPATEERILLVLQLEALRRFVAADIEGADDDRMGLGPLGDEAVIFELFLFIGRLGPIQIEKFGSIKPDSLRAAARDVIEFSGQLDVCGENDVAAIAGRRGGIADKLKAFGDLDFPQLDFSVFLKCFRGGVENEETRVAIEQHVIAAG